MPDYRRLVSYMYNYEDGIKRNNVGYARVEARNGQCKCTLHIAAPSLNEKQLKAYIFKRNKGGLLGVLLGTFYVRNGIGDYRVITESAHIMNTPYSLDEMGGIVLYLSEKKFFATEWDDSPITKELVSTIEEKLEKKENPEHTKDETKEEIHGKEKSLQGTDTITDPEMVTAAGVKVINIKTEYFNNGPVTENNNEENTNQNNTAPENKINTTPNERSESDESSMLENPCGKLIIDNPESNDSIKENDETRQEDNETDSRQNPINDTPTADILPETQSVETESLQNEIYQMEVDQQHNEKHAIEDAMDLDNVFSIPNQKKEYYEEIALESDELEKEEDLYDSLEEELDQGDVVSESLNSDSNKESLDDTVNSSECQKEQTRPFFEDHPLAKRIYRSFPRMYPFEDNEIAWCVKIEPQDIGLFPMEAWVLGNNSFLLHGYYSYRHLIFARMNDKNGFSYILGVPGIYHNREKFMAKMFGFENFKSVKRKERRTGEFGYWYIPILLS